MSSKYVNILDDLLTRFYVDTEVDERTRRIVKGVINAEINRLDLKSPYGIKKEIKEIIEREAKAALKT